MKFKIERIDESKTERVSEAKLDEMIHDYRKALDDLCIGAMTDNEIIEYVKAVMAEGRGCRRQPQYRFWGFAEPETMPGDIRVYYYYTPTYIITAFLMKAFMVLGDKADSIDGFADCLKRALGGSTGRGFQNDWSPFGGGPDYSMALEPFCRADAGDFVRKYPDFCPEFTKLFNKTVGHYELPQGKMPVFVYGTLLSGQSNHDSYLGDAEFLGEAEIAGYYLYDMGSYPALKNHKSARSNNSSSGSGSDYANTVPDTIKGELYMADNETIKRLDRLEGEGSLYKRDYLTVWYGDSQEIEAIIYMFLSEPDDSLLMTSDNYNGIRWNGKIH